MSAEAVQKQIALISRRGPYAQGQARAALDLVLSAAVFDQVLHYIFMDDGVYQLLPNQQGEAIERKDVSSALAALELYGIERVFADSTSLCERGLKDRELIAGVEIVDRGRIAELIRRSDLVYNF